MPVVMISKEAKDNLNPRQPNDVYETEIKLALACCSLFARTREKILDVGAGSGIWGKAIHQLMPRAILYGVELRDLPSPDEYLAWDNNIDYLKWGTNTKFDLIIGNPPFKKAEEFILYSRQFLSENGKIGFLLPSTFQHGQHRGRTLFTIYRPEIIYALMQRPNFTDFEGKILGNANPSDYIFVIWDKQSCDFAYHDWLDWKNK